MAENSLQALRDREKKAQKAVSAPRGIYRPLTRQAAKTAAKAQPAPYRPLAKKAKK